MKDSSQFNRHMGVVLCILALATLSACRSRPLGSAGSAAPPESSVKPGINAEYLKPDLNASNWVERFEREGREIFDQRGSIVAAGFEKIGEVPLLKDNYVLRFRKRVT